MLDVEKLRDIKKLSKDEFLKSYSYLDEDEYEMLLIQSQEIDKKIEQIIEAVEGDIQTFATGFVPEGASIETDFEINGQPEIYIRDIIMEILKLEESD